MQEAWAFASRGLKAKVSYCRELAAQQSNDGKTGPALVRAGQRPLFSDLDGHKSQLQKLDKGGLEHVPVVT